MTVQEIHQRLFSKSAALSSFQMDGVIRPIEVIRVLNRAKVRFVLAGAYGLAGWQKESRATEDVDVVVAPPHVKKAVSALLAAFSQLEAVDLPMGVRLRDRHTKDVLIDVMKPLQQPYREVFKHSRQVSPEGENYRIPTLEMAIVMKFSAMTSLYRASEDKHRDAHDFIRMVKNNPKLDETKLGHLALLLYPEAQRDVLNLVRKARDGETLIL